MKIRKIIYFAACCLILNQQSKGQSLNDDFNGTSVNASLWNVILPFDQSQISESGGSLTTTGRGTLETVAGFSSPYTVSGAVTLNNSLEHFSVTLRSDLQTGYQSTDGSFYYELTGVKAEFSADGNQISIQQFTPNDTTILSLASYSFFVGQTYDFSVTDTGSEIDFAINGVSLLSAATTYATGDQIAFQSREFPDISSSLDFVSIAPVPEPSSFALAGLGSLILKMYSKIKAPKKKFIEGD